MSGTGAKDCLIDRKALRTLIEWCADSIDFKDETDAAVAKAFRKVVRGAELHFYHGLLGNL